MALVSLVQTKLYLSIASSTDDDLLTMFIDIANDRLNSLVGRILDSSTHTDEVMTFEDSNTDLQVWTKFDLAGESKYLFLEQYPITSFVSLKADSVALVVDEDYYVLEDEGVLIMASHINDSFKNLLATYIAGYAENGAPKELNWIIYEMVKIMYQNSKTPVAGQQDVSTKKIGEFSITYKSEDVGTFTGSMEVQSIINKYKRYSL